MNETVERRKREAQERREALLAAGEQTCAACGIVRPIGEFAERVQPWTGFRSIQSTCRTCQNARSAQRKRLARRAS